MTWVWKGADVHVSRIGFTPVKGTRHREHAEVHLAEKGPVGDRDLCLVDVARSRVLRTVEAPALMQVVATTPAGLSGRDGTLRLDLPDATVEAPVTAGGEVHRLDYWGRIVEVEVVPGPWATALSDHLGRAVVLARARRGGDIVYGGPVTLVSAGSLAALERRLGTPVDSARFRSTFVLDTGDTGADEDTGAGEDTEDGWLGATVVIGEAVLRVRAAVPRCAVVDVDPVSGERDLNVLATLAGYRRCAGEVTFGVDAEVVRPGRVRSADPVTVERI